MENVILLCSEYCFVSKWRRSGVFIVNLEYISWRRFSVFIVNFEHISHLVLVFLLLTL